MIRKVLIPLLLSSLLLGGCSNGVVADKILFSNTSVTDITESTVTISWTTDKAATGQIMYGTTVDYGQVSTLVTEFDTSHSIALAELEADTVYHFKINSRDSSGNEAASDDATFQTSDTVSPAITGVTVSDITTTSATISWSTDEEATSQVAYGTSAAYGQLSNMSMDLVTNHVVNISNLSAGIKYHFSVSSIDDSENIATSEDQTFTTLSSQAAELTIHFIDVGQGDSILLDIDETEVLIDGGGKSPGAVSYINDHVDGALEVVVATHPHADHIGGLIDVLSNFEVDQIWLNGDTTTSQTYADFSAAVQAEGALVYEARRGDEIHADDLTFSVLHPTNTNGTTNNNSIVLSLSYGEVDFIFTGDAEQEAETSMLAAGVVMDVEILKVGHHGSRTASSTDFLQSIQPEVAIYMCKTGNSYGHPHSETITSLGNIGATIYGTDEEGTIVVTTNGVTYEVEP